MSVVAVTGVQPGSAPKESAKAKARKGFWNTPKVFWSSVFLALILLLAILGPILGPEPNAINPDIPTSPPWPLAGYVAGHWFGTDDLGRDLLSRVAVGARISLLIGFATAVVA